MVFLEMQETKKQNAQWEPQKAENEWKIKIGRRNKGNK